MSLWRTEDPVLTEPNDKGLRTVLKGGMWPKGREWWNLQNFVRLLVGGYGSGKTRQLCKWGISTACHNAPAWTVIVSPNFPMARRTVIPTLIELLEGKRMLREDFKFKHLKGEKAFSISITGRPTATLMYLTGDNPDNLKGPNIGCAGIDEPFIQDRAVFDQMVARCRDPRAKLHAIGATGTPEQLNWGYEIAEGDDRDKYDIGVVHADTRENLALPPDYAKRLIRSYDAKAMEAYVAGKFVSLSTGRVYYAFDKDRNVKDLGPRFSGIPFAGMDFNVDPMAFCVGGNDPGTKQVFITHEYEIPNSDTAYACALLRENHPTLKRVFPDPSGKSRHTNAPGGVSDFTFIGRSGMIVFAPMQAGGRRDAENAVNKKLEDGSLIIHPRCKKLIHYLSEHTHELAKKQESMTHLLDALKYPIVFMFPIYKPTTSVASVRGL